MVVGPPRETHPAAPWSEVLALFGLPSLLHPPTTIVGGWTHGLWRVKTLDGTYAIKEMVVQPGDWWIEQLDTAMAFELAAWRSGRILMAEPIPVAGSDQLLGRLEVGVSSSATAATVGSRASRVMASSPTSSGPAESARSSPIWRDWTSTRAQQLISCLGARSTRSRRPSRKQATREWSGRSRCVTWVVCGEPSGGVRRACRHGSADGGHAP